MDGQNDLPGTAPSDTVGSAVRAALNAAAFRLEDMASVLSVGADPLREALLAMNGRGVCAPAVAWALASAQGFMQAQRATRRRACPPPAVRALGAARVPGLGLAGWPGAAPGTATGAQRA